MVKTPKTRHARTQREPMTIELGPDEVTRVDSDETPPETPAADAAPSEPIAEAMERAEGDASEATAAASDAPDPQELVAEAEKPAGVTPERPSGYDFPDQSPAGEAGKADDRPAAAVPPAASPQRGPSLLAALAAGLLGGVIVVGGASLLGFGRGEPATAPPSLDGVNASIDTLRAEVEALKVSASPADLSGRIDSFGTALQALQADLASLRQTVQEADAGAPAVDLAPFEQRLAALESSVASLSGNSADAEALTLLGERIAAVEALAKAASEAGSAVEGRLGAVEQGLSALTARVDAQAQQPKIALAIAAAALKSAVERGVPFTAEVETFAAVVPDAPDLTALRGYAEMGVPTRAAIQGGVAAAADAMVAAGAPVDENAGFFDRLLQSAQSLVSVRPIGAVPGEGVPETVARLEVAVQAGDFAAALAEYETLPEAVKAAGATYAEQIRARLEVERLVDEVIAAAMKA